MNKQELQRIKDIAVLFAHWKDENCIDYCNGKAYLAHHSPDPYEMKLMSYEELFDYFMHEILVIIELENKGIENGH